MDAEIHLEPAAGAQGGAASWAPHAPSYIDRFTAWVEALPFPYGLSYLGLFVLHLVISVAVSWFDGWLPAGAFSPVLLLFPVWLWGSLAIITHLDRIAAEALADFGSLHDLDAGGMRRMEYEFTVMPRGGVLLTAVAWSVAYAALIPVTGPEIIPAYGFGTAATVFMIGQGLITFAIGGVIYYHSIRQLWLVRRTVNTVERFDVFQLGPVYAFSVLTSRTGIGWVLLLTATLLIFPIQLGGPPALVTMGIQVVLAILAFTLPLQVVHRRLTAEKRRLQAEHGARLETTLTRLHERVDSGQLAEVSAVNDTIAGLNSEREILARIPTWPWRAGVLTGFLSIVILPIALFLTQLVLGRLLGT
jgi:hypothetical protein